MLKDKVLFKYISTIHFLEDKIKLIDSNLQKNISPEFRQELIISQECYKTILRQMKINEDI